MTFLRSRYVPGTYLRWGEPKGAGFLLAHGVECQWLAEGEERGSEIVPGEAEEIRP